jgi:hypothetical protein
LTCGANWQASRWIAGLLEELEVTVSVTGFAFSGRTEQSCNIVLTFNVSLVCEIQIATVSLRLACEGVFQALFRARAFECCHGYLLDIEKNALTDLSKTIKA